MHLVEEDTRIKNEFCYLKKMNHMYDLKIVEFEGGDTKSQGLKGSPKNGAGYAEEYITISSRGITYFSKDSSRFVPLAEWKREAEYFGKLMKLDFFGKHKLMKNFSNWKKFSLKIFMKKTSDHLKNHLLLNDRHLRSAILGVRSLCCEM